MKRKFVLALVASMAIGNAWATEPFRVHRWESFYGLPITTGNTVFVGNSITNMHDWWEAFGDNQSILNRGTSGGFTYEVLDHLEMIIAGKPAKLFLGIGTNDITAYTPETVSDNIRIIAERIINESPDTYIYVQSVLPSTSGNRGQRNPELNRQIAEKVAALKAKYPSAKLDYVDVFSLFVADNGYGIKNYNGLSLAYDALHPTVLGYGLWCHEIADRVGSNCIYDTTVSQMYNGGQNNSTGDRITCFAQQVVDADDVLIIGDEMVSSGEWHELFGSPNVKNRGLGWGYTGSQLTQEITNAPIYFQNANSVAPKAIVVYAGVQEARDNLTAANFKTRYTQLITALRNSKATSEKTKIFLLSPLHTPDATQSALIDTYQEQLQALADELENVYYIDATSLNNAESENYYRGDGGNYLTSLGYVRLANKIEDALTAQLGSLGHNMVTEAQAITNKALYANRDIVGDALTTALRLQGKEGSGIGQYSNLSALNEPISAAYELLASGNITAEAATSAKNALSIALPEINQPTSGKYYTLCSVNRGSKYLTSDGTNVIGTGDANYAKNQWQIVARENGGYDLISRADGKYLTTAAYDAQLTVSTTAPTNGWTFTGSNSAGLYNVANSTCEINMTTSKFNNLDGVMKVVNWSNGETGADRNDTGCQFQLAEVEGEPDILPDTPEHGKVFTIYNDHVGTPYYLTNTNTVDGKTDLTATKAEDKSQQWIVWGNTANGYELINVANGAKVTSHNGYTAFDIDNIKAKVGISLFGHGTQAHIAGNATKNTLSGGIFTKTSNNNAVYNEYVNNGTGDKWSSDFVFFATGENAYKVASDNVTISGEAYDNGAWVITTTALTPADITVEDGYKAVITNNTITAVEKGDVTIVEERVKNQSEIVAGTKIAMKVNVNNQTNGWFGIPKGSADTKTWYTVEEGSATGTIILKTDDGKYIGTNTSTSALEYVNAAADATNIYLEAEGDGTDNAKYMFKNSAGTTNTTAKALALENNANLGAAWWDRGSAPRIRLEVYKQTEVEETPEEPTPVYYTLTNHQKNNTTYTLYIYNGELTVSSANASATSLGDAALFTKEVHDGKWAFKSKTTGQYLIWRGDNGGQNSNKGVMDTFDATYCDFTPVASTNYPGGYYLVGKRSGGTVAGSWVITSAGEWNKFSDAEGWADGHSNIFTIDEVVGEEGKSISISNGTGSFNAESGFLNTWTSSSTPVVTVKAYAGTENVNNMQKTDDGSAFVNYTGNRNGASKLTVSVPEGYVITGYSFDVTKNNGDGAVTLTTPNNSSWSISSIADAKSETYTFPEGVQSFDLGFTGANEGLKFTNFKVTVKEYVVDPSTITYPFVSEEAFTEATHWYAIKLNGKYCYAADNNSVQLNPRTPDTTKEEYLWCVTGNNTDGYTIYNKKTQKAITFASGADKTYATLADPTANNNSAFIVATSTASTNPQAYSFHFGANSYLNDYAGGGTLAIWDNNGGANGNGSGLMFIEPAEGIEDAIAPFYVFDNVESKQTTGVPYRIPAVAKNRAGDLVFAADYRYSKADIGMATNGKLDLRFRIKKADGTWTDVETLVSNGKWKKAADGSYVKDETNGTFTAFGDPCIVADRESDLVMVTSCCGNVSFPSGTPENHQGWSRFLSTDGGYTWSEYYTDLAPQVFEQINKRTDGYQLKCFFIGSGKISQSRTIKVGNYYRLYCSALATIQKTGASNINVNYVFYSDDFGEKWHLLGSADDCPIPSDANEPKAEELPDGSVVVSSRTGGRHFNVYHYTNTATGKGAWGNRVTSNKNNNGTWGANCNGEIMTVPVKKTGTEEKSFLFLQSIPRDANRNYVGIFWKPLNNLADYRTTEQIAPNWGDDHFLQLSTTTSAYSTMCMDNKNDIAFFYEENDFNSGYDMVYKNVTISQLTNGAYEYCEMTHADSVAYLKAGVEPFVESVKATNFGPYVGQYAESAQSSIEAAVAAYKDAPATATYDALNTALATASTRRINPAKQYRIINIGRSTATDTYALAYDADYTAKFKGANEDANDPNQRFQFVATADGKFYIKSKASGSMYGILGGNETEATGTENTASAGTFVIESTPDGKSALKCTNKTGSNWYIHLAGGNTRLVPWSATDASLWKILPIDEPLDITNEGEYTQLDVEALTNIVSGVATKENNESGNFNYNFDAADLNDDNVYTIGDIARLIRLLLDSAKK